MVVVADDVDGELRKPLQQHRLVTGAHGFLDFGENENVWHGGRWYSARSRKVGTPFFGGSRLYNAKCGRGKYPQRGDPHCGPALSSGALVGTFHADRSKPGGLAIRCCLGNSSFLATLVGGILSFGPPLDGRHALNFAVRGAVRVLDLLPAPRAAVAENDLAAECADYDGRAAAATRCPRGAAEAKKSGNGHYARAIRSPMSPRRLHRQRLLRRPHPRRHPRPRPVWLASGRHWCFLMT